MSYDLLMGYTGILSFGHAMFFGTGAYATGILLKHAGWSLGPVVLAVIGVAVVQSILVGVVSLRVRGVYLAMATLAFAQMFFILVQATDLRDITGAEDGLHGIPVPAWLNPTDQRLTFYFLALAFCVVMYLIARRVVDSPPGRVMVAIRENEAARADDRLQHLRVQAAGRHPLRRHGRAGRADERPVEPERHAGRAQRRDDDQRAVDDHHRRRRHAGRPHAGRGGLPVAGVLAE